MPGLVTLLHLDRFSFWMGVLAATLFWWFFSGLRQVWPRLKLALKTRSTNLRQFSAAGIDERLRRETLRQSQALLIASPLFSLDEIVIPPKLLALLPQADPDDPNLADDAITRTIAYTPDWPEVAAVYGNPTLELIQPLVEGVSFAIAAQPGQGKTTALAYLAGVIARRETPSLALNNSLPILIHIADLLPTIENKCDPVKLIIELVANHSPAMIMAQVPGFLRNYFTEGKIILLIDGLDELPATTLREVSRFMLELRQNYPGLPLVITCSPEYWDGLALLGLKFYALAAWNQDQASSFVKKWGDCWQKSVQPILPVKSQQASVDPDILQSWLANYSSIYSPLEWTLFAWALFAGDLSGPRVSDAVESYILRGTEPRIRPALEKLALQSVLFAQIASTRQECDSILAEGNRNTPPEESLAEIQAAKNSSSTSSENQATPNTLIEKKTNPNTVSISALVENGILVNRSDNRISFIHPLIMGYLAAGCLSKESESASRLITQQSWTGQNLTLHFLGAIKDISTLVEPMVKDLEEPTFRNLFIVARWLKDARDEFPWKANTIRHIAELLQIDTLPMPIRQRLLNALVCSNDPVLPVLFRQMLLAKSARTIQLGVVGLGMIQETKATPDLARLLSNSSQNVKDAICLSLVAMGINSAIETVAKLLLQADEDTRRSAAEALSNNPREGYQVLKEGSGISDILVRRAVIYGISRISAPWARDILEKIRIEDGQWVVRNVAAEAIEASQKPTRLIHKPLPMPAQSPWLVAYAARQGVGIPANSPAIELLILALKTGNEEQQLAALEYLAFNTHSDVISAIYDAAYNGIGFVREAAINLLYEDSAAGVSVPSPSTFGFGSELLRNRR